MVNAWSLAYDTLNGTLDENFPIMTGNIEINTGLGNTAANFAEELTITIPPNSVVRGGDYADAVDHLVDEMPSSFNTLSDNDDAIAHLIDKPVSSGIEDNLSLIHI